jgi:hypothetical protein
MVVESSPPPLITGWFLMREKERQSELTIHSKSAWQAARAWLQLVAMAKTRRLSFYRALANRLSGLHFGAFPRLSLSQLH